jgi:hypothetical protein
MCELSEHVPIVPTFCQECRDGQQISLPNYFNKEARKESFGWSQIQSSRRDRPTGTLLGTAEMRRESCSASIE